MAYIKNGLCINYNNFAYVLSPQNMQQRGAAAAMAASTAASDDMAAT